MKIPFQNWFWNLFIFGCPFVLGISSSSSKANQTTGGTQTGSAGQAVGTGNEVNTGTQTTVETNKTTTQNSDNQLVGNSNVITYNTGVTADELGEIIGNAITGSSGGGGGINISPTPTNAAVNSNNVSSAVKWGLGLAALAALVWLWRKFRKSS